jgi:RNA polymerase sigma factor (sigma-70 family)
MKKYNVQNYIKYKEDLKKSILNLEGKFWDEYTRDELIVKFLPLVENIARKFSTTQQASGVLSINDLIQEGSIGLTAAVDRLDWNKLKESDDIEKTLKSFLSKRIKGAIRRAIDINRGDIKIPEHKLIEMRKNEGKDRKITEMFFNSVFSSIDEPIGDDEDSYYQVPDKSEPYNIDLLNIYLLGIMKTYLTDKEYDVVRMSYGLDCDKMSAKEIANELGIDIISGFVRVSQIKRDAINKLIDNVPPNQVLDYL